MNINIALFVSVLTLAGCASSQAAQPPTAAAPAAATEAPPGHGMGHDMAGSCPMEVEGTTARAEDVEGGAAMAFTTTGDVAELRRRVAHMVEMHEMHHGEGHGAMMGGGDDKGMMAGGDDKGMMAGGDDKGMMAGGDDKGMMGGGMMMPPATARSEEIEGGARLVFIPKDPADLPKLREHARQHAEKMASGQCPMMHGHGAPGAPEAHHS
jgi:hypothetical protein